ncbi:MAG: hypothetical protein LBU51_01265, partial [Bacteroidales bacterium]|nr:hypothetical protein [Bacteroidales bacterium]
MSKNIKINAVALLFSLLMVVYVLSSPLISGDAEWFRGMAKDCDYHYLSFAVSRYGSWSSRLLIESITAYFSVHYIQFIVMIFLISLLFMTSIIRLLELNDQKYRQYRLVILMIALLFFPINSVFDGAGVIPTMTNYYVPMCLMAYVLLVIKQESKLYSYLLKLLSFILVVMQEQFALLAAIIFMVVIVDRLIQKLPTIRYLPFLLFSMLGILSAKLSPGNAVRNAREIKERFPDFENVSLIRKLDIGFIRMSYDLLFQGQITLFFILVLISILIFAMLKRKFNQVVGLITLLAIIILPYLNIWTPLSKMKNVYDTFPKDSYGNTLSITGRTIDSVYPDLMMILMIVTILLIIWTVLTTTRDRVIVLTLL